ELLADHNVRSASKMNKCYLNLIEGSRSKINRSITITIRYTVFTIIRTFTCLLFFLAPWCSLAQTPAHSGTEFHFFRHTSWRNPTLTLHITSSHNTSGKIDVGIFDFDGTFPFTVKAGETVAVEIPGSLPSMMVDHAERRFAHITSEKPIEVT